MTPTAYGARLSGAARTALEALRDEMRVGRSFDPARDERRFQLYMSDVGQTVFLPALLRHLTESARGVTLQVAHIPDIGPAAALESGQVDLLVGHLASIGPGYYQRRLFRERYVCIASKHHPHINGSLSVQKLVQATHAVSDAGGMAHDRVISASLEKHGIRRRVGLAVPEYMTLPFAVANSEFVAILPKRLAMVFATTVPLQLLPPPIPLPAYDVRMFWHKRVHSDAANRWLRTQFVELFST